MFLEYLVPRLGTLKESIIKSMFYTIQKNLGLVGRPLGFVWLTEDIVFSEYLILPPESAIWRKFPNLKPSVLKQWSDFRRHPDVLKGNSSSDQLLKEFDEKMEVFLSFGNYIDFDLTSLCRFFSFYIGSKVKDEYFWFLVHKVFRISCTDFASLSKYAQSEDLKKGVTDPRANSQRTRERTLKATRARMGAKAGPGGGTGKGVTLGGWTGVPAGTRPTIARK